MYTGVALRMLNEARTDQNTVNRNIEGFSYYDSIIRQLTMKSNHVTNVTQIWFSSQILFYTLPGNTASKKKNKTKKLSVPSLISIPTLN